MRYMILLLLLLTAPAFAQDAESPLWDTFVEIAWQAAAAAAVTGFTLFKASKWFKDLGFPQRILAEAVAAGVQYAYLKVVQPAKENAPEGKLTQEQALEARAVATSHAIETAHDLGYPHELDAEMVEPMVQEQVRAVKVDAADLKKVKWVRQGKNMKAVRS